MKLSIIWKLSEDEKKNERTGACLQEALQGSGIDAELLVYPQIKKQVNYEVKLSAPVSVCGQEGLSMADILSDAVKKTKGDWITFLEGGDFYSQGALDKLCKEIEAHKNYGIFLFKKEVRESETPVYLSEEPAGKSVALIDLYKKFYCHPYFFGGTFIKKDLFKEEWIVPSYGIETERGLMLSAAAARMNLVYLRECVYTSDEAREGDLTFFKELYNPDYYERIFDDFWIPFMQGFKEEIPKFVQVNLMFSIRSRMLANQNNKNKHAIPEGEEEKALLAIGRALQFVEDDIMFNALKLEGCIVPDSFKWVYGILKYGPDYSFEKCYVGGVAHYFKSKTVFNKIYLLRTNIQFMNYENGYLYIDGMVHPLLHNMADEIYFMFNDKKYLLNYNQRYGLIKVYGKAIYKDHAFHIALPMHNVKSASLFCFANFGQESIKIHFSFESHTSRISGRFENSYWSFGVNTRYMVEHADNGLLIHRTKSSELRKKERALQKEMFLSKSKRAWLFIAVRKAYFAAKPFMKKRPIWMYLDKIYKGGDSSEYLYRYASKQNNNFKHYYLIDKNSTDYKRLKKDGFKPLVRGSLKHRLVFLMADMMVISNSTVFAFNDFGMVNSSYVRDLVDFHVCCVQHGMSVQKIAIAQNRLRDNTRLYFCASKYEIQNLIHPVYDYKDYNALKLTGVPRYDGLVDKSKKQIMISPTWRMQAAVPVRTSEGHQRDYNPLFKETTYYKVFNSLINDKRLLEAAEKYGYQIKYVLHPIVSAQVNDFDKNDYVEVIPAVGDMSYEKMFCESSLMVTDFSGIQFDFAYMRKPLVYLHHKDIPQHYEEGSFFYDTMAFGEICHDNDELIDLLCEYMANGCKMKPEYVRRADDFFYYRDHNNCERIYNEMVRYQDEHILHPTDEDTYEIDKLSTITESYYNIPLDEKKVVLVGLGKHVRGNMQYILDELNHSDRFEGYQIYVRTDSSTDDIVNYYIITKQWKRTHSVKNDVEYSHHMESAKYLLTEVYFPESWVKKPGQVYINIWHGTPLKKLGLAKNSKNLHKDGNTQRNFINADYLLYPNDYTMKNMLVSYKVADLLQGKALLLGYPRTGGMLMHEKEDQDAIRGVLAPKGEKVYAYMPTWKDYLKVEQVVAESKELLEYLDENLRDDQILYVNLHHKVSDVLDYSVFTHIKKFPATVDSYALLSATDALITDYSSVFYDYLAMQKQIVLYCADYELYRERRGTYMDLMELPFDKARTKEEVLAALNRGKQYDDAAAHKEFCGYDSVENARKLCSLMLPEPDDDLNLLDIEKSGRKQILMYTTDCAEVKETEILKSYLYYEQAEDLLTYVGNDMDAVKPNKKNAYPMMYDFPPFGTSALFHLTPKGKSVKNAYLAGKISFPAAMETLEKEYDLVHRRMFGRAIFDEAVILDVFDPELLISLAMLETKKVLVVSNRMAAELEKGNMFLRDAFGYAARSAEAIYKITGVNEEILHGVLGANVEISEIADGTDLAKAVRTCL